MSRPGEIDDNLDDQLKKILGRRDGQQARTEGILLLILTELRTLNQLIRSQGVGGILGGGRTEG